MNDPAIIIAAIAGGAVVLAPTVTGILNIMANNRNAQLAMTLAMQQAKTTDKKLDDVHVLVNSRLSKALTEISELRIQVSKLKRTRSAEQAAANAVADAEEPVVDDPAVSEDSDVKE